MDCLAMEGIGYIAISNAIEDDVVDLDEASPVFKVTANRVEVVQYFSMPFQNKAYLRFVFHSQRFRNRQSRAKIEDSSKQGIQS